MKKLKDIVDHFINELKDFYDLNESKSLAYWLLEFKHNLSRSNYLLEQNRELEVSEYNFYTEALNRLKNYEPIQYIVGETEFKNLTFKVADGCLIPRPETEELVDWILQHEFDNALDIGTGSGCIAVSLSKLSKANIKAIDVCSKALAIARKNAMLNKVSVDFMEMDIFNFREIEKVDLIVSNPPYVLEREKKYMKFNVLDFEPHKALFVKNDDPLIFYKQILLFSELTLKNNGLIFFEINELFKDEMCTLLHRHNFIDIEVKKDLNNKFRMLKATKS